MKDLPVIDIFEYLVGFSLAMSENKVLLDPFYDVILEGTFDNLMKEVRCNHFVDVGSGEMGGERLNQYAS